jgi:hypothetical protein
VTSSRVASIAAVALLAALPARSSAHELDEYLQAARVSLSRSHVVCDIDLTPGADVVSPILSLVDRDGDRLVSPQEAEAYGRAVLLDVTFELDGRAVPLTLTRVEVPPVGEMNAGVGTIRISASGRPGVLGSGRHHLYFRNDHVPEGSVYLANALLPDSRDIVVARQVRDPRQREIRVEYEVRAALSAQLLWSLAGIVVVAFPVMFKTRNLRRLYR